MKERDKIPPKVPEQLPQLDRAVMLLASLTKGNLKPRYRLELVQLVGREPKNAEQAAAWKAALKALRKEERELFSV